VHRHGARPPRRLRSLVCGGGVCSVRRRSRHAAPALDQRAAAAPFAELELVTARVRARARVRVTARARVRIRVSYP